MMAVRRYPKGSYVNVLHGAQVSWAAEQAEGLRSYFEGRGEAEKAASVVQGWPVRPLPVAA